MTVLQNRMPNHAHPTIPRRDQLCEIRQKEDLVSMTGYLFSHRRRPPGIHEESAQSVRGLSAFFVHECHADIHLLPQGKGDPDGIMVRMAKTLIPSFRLHGIHPGRKIRAVAYVSGVSRTAEGRGDMYPRLIQRVAVHPYILCLPLHFHPFCDHIMDH